MKKENQNTRNRISDKVLLNDVKRVAKKWNKDHLTVKEYDKFGKYSRATFQKRFGSWKNAVIKIGLKPGKRGGYNIVETKEFLEDLKRVAERINTNAMSFNKYKNNSGKFSSASFFTRFGGWNKAIEYIGLKPRKRIKPASSNELVEDLKAVAEKLNTGSLTYKAYKNNSGKYSSNTFSTRFGNWKKAVEQIGLKSIYNKDPAFKEILLEDMKRVAMKLNVVKLSIITYRNNSGKYDPGKFAYWFGSWNEAAKTAGLKTSGSSIPKETLLADLKRVAQLLNKNTITEKEYKNNSAQYSSPTFVKYFGSWNNAKEAAGLKAGKKNVSPNDILANISEVAKLLETEKFSFYEYTQYGNYSLYVICKAFETWKNAKQQAMKKNEP